MGLPTIRRSRLGIKFSHFWMIPTVGRFDFIVIFRNAIDLPIVGSPILKLSRR